METIMRLRGMMEKEKYNYTTIICENAKYFINKCDISRVD